MKSFSIFLIFLLKVVSSQIPDTDVEENSSGWYQIEGKVYAPEIGTEENWQEETQIIINSGEIKGFLKGDGTFIISKVPSGSYVVEILNPNYLYEPVRVEINNKGKFRARKVNVS
jgi:ER membrane protein complex subunit 7